MTKHSPENFNNKSFTIGRIACLITFILGVIYAIVTSIGFLELKSPQEPISNPWFTLMEILDILIAFSMAVSMTAVHNYALPVDKTYSLMAAVFMYLMTGITSCVHFVILVMNNFYRPEQIPGFSFFFSFKWPSVGYALDILAWDWFFALSMLLGASVFKFGQLAKPVRFLMIISGILSLIGLLGVPLNNMQIRNIGIIGYALVAPIIFLLISIIFRRLDKNQI